MTPPPRQQPSTGAPPFPPEALRGLVGDYVGLVEPCTEAPAAFHAASFLAVTGILLGRRTWVAQGSRVWGNVFTVLVAPTAHSRKSTALDLAAEHILEPLAPNDETFTADYGDGSGEGFLQAVADLRDRTDTAGNPKPDVTGRRLVIFADEFTGLLRKARQGRGATLVPFLLRAANAPSRLTLTVRKNALVATDALVGLVGSTTFRSLERELEVEAIEGGFVNRLLFVTGEPTAPKPRPPEPDRLALGKLRQELQDSIGQATPGRMEFSPKAAKRWDAWYVTPRPTKSEAIDQATARLTTHGARLALLYAILDGADRIEDDHVEAGIALAEFSASVAESVVEGFAASEHARAEARILVEIPKRADSHGWAEVRRVQQGLSKIVAARDFQPALRALESVGTIELRSGPPRKVRIMP